MQSSRRGRGGEAGHERRGPPSRPGLQFVVYMLFEVQEAALRGAEAGAKGRRDRDQERKQEPRPGFPTALRTRGLLGRR